MKKMLILVIVIAIGCKKSTNSSNNSSSTDGYTISNIHDSTFFFAVPPSDTIGDNISSVTSFPAGSTYGAGYEVLLAPGMGGLESMEFFTPSLNVNLVSYDSTSYYITGALFVVNGTLYLANSLTIKSLNITMTPHVWPTDLWQSFNTDASGTFDITFVERPPVRDTIEVKGKFSNIYGAQ